MAGPLRYNWQALETADSTYVWTALDRDLMTVAQPERRHNFLSPQVTRLHAG